MLKELTDHVTHILQRTIYREQKEDTRKKVVESKYKESYDKAFKTAKLRGDKIQTAIVADHGKKRRKIVTSEEYHDLLARRLERYDKVMDELEKQAMYL